MTTSDVDILQSRAAQLLDEGDLDGALGALSDVPSEERDGAIEGLHGVDARHLRAREGLL